MNPFENDVVTDAWLLPVKTEVESINKRALDGCIHVFNMLKAREMSDSILLFGPPGSGKSHLLNRLQRRLTEADGGRGEKCAFIYVRLNTVAAMLWQFLRQCFVDDLLRTLPDGSNQLKRIIAGQLANRDTKRRNQQHWLDRFSNIAGGPLPQWKILEDLFQDANIDLDISLVIKHLLVNRHRRQARAWLRGENLPENDLKKLGLNEPSGNLDLEQQGRKTVLTLCYLAGADYPVLFCFDQVESIMMDRNDKDSFFSLAQVGAAIFNATQNVILIFGIQSSLLKFFQESAREANWDRIARRSLPLNLLSKDEARELIKKRLEMVPELKQRPPNTREEELYPLNFTKLEDLFSHGCCSARKLLHRCRKDYNEWLEKDVEDENLETFLTQKYQSKRTKALQENLVGNSDSLLRQAIPWLTQALDSGVNARQAYEEEEAKKIDMVLWNPADNVMLSICNQANMNSLGARLKKLRQGLEAGLIQALVIFRHDNRPISKTAKKTQEYWEYLTKNSRAIVWGAKQDMASLEAFRSLVSSAKSGNLAYQGEDINERLVYKWFKNNPDKILLEFLENLVNLNIDNTFDEIWEKLRPAVQESYVVSLEEMANSLGLTDGDIINCIATRSQRNIGVIHGEPTILFEYIYPDIINAKAGE